MDGVVGRPLDRVDGRLKVTGHARYTADQPVANVAYGVLVTSAIARGRIASLETRAAAREPGVLAVLTHLDAPRLPAQGQGASPAQPVVIHATEASPVAAGSARPHRRPCPGESVP